MLHCTAKQWERHGFGMKSATTSDVSTPDNGHLREQQSFYGMDLTPLYKDAMDEMFGKDMCLFFHAHPWT